MSDMEKRKVLPPIRVTEEQKKKYEETASRRNKSLSDWLRKLADDDCKRD